jgi:hypothetical protein
VNLTDSDLLIVALYRCDGNCPDVLFRAVVSLWDSDSAADREERKPTTPPVAESPSEQKNN